MSYVKDFVLSVQAVIGGMAATDATAGEPYLKDSRSAFGDITGLMGMASVVSSGMMVLSFERPAILGIFTAMLGEQLDNINDDVVDAVGELTNMVCGEAKRRFAEHGFKFDMAAPIVVVGREVYIRDRAGRQTTVIPFSTRYGNFVLESNIFD